jgi:hypothetical protein
MELGARSRKRAVCHRVQATRTKGISHGLTQPSEARRTTRRVERSGQINTDDFLPSDSRGFARQALAN